MRKLKNEELDRKTITEFKEANKIPVILVLDNIRSLNNVGSVFRTADGFLFESIYLCGITGTPPNKDIHKTALGATDTVHWQYFDTTATALLYLKEKKVLVYAIEQAENSLMLQDFQVDKTNTIALVFGNEVNGVEQSVINQCDGIIEIPQAGVKHSLNIAVSAGIVAWEMFKQYNFLP
jgi:tRNA G18 (ribose-2'-O)-methylase SpoU